MGVVRVSPTPALKKPWIQSSQIRGLPHVHLLDNYRDERYFAAILERPK